MPRPFSLAARLDVSLRCAREAGRRQECARAQEQIEGRGLCAADRHSQRFAADQRARQCGGHGNVDRDGGRARAFVRDARQFANGGASGARALSRRSSYGWRDPRYTAGGAARRWHGRDP